MDVQSFVENLYHDDDAGTDDDDVLWTGIHVVVVVVDDDDDVVGTMVVSIGMPYMTNRSVLLLL
jgi:hypothetical protein